MKKAIIFDLDGVLVFTDKYHYQAWKEMADGIGVYFDEKINDRLRGVSRMESLEIILERSGEQYSQMDKEILASRKNDIYRKLLGNMTPADAAYEVRRTLAQLRSRGYLLAIGSSSRNTKYILERTALTEYFDAISDGTNITKSKPDPEVFLKAAQFLQVSPSDCAVIEDAVSGIEAAKAAGMMSVGIGDAIPADLPDRKIGSFGELLEVFPASGYDKITA